jgi:hypothetical protein
MPQLDIKGSGRLSKQRGKIVPWTFAMRLGKAPNWSTQ